MGGGYSSTLYLRNRDGQNPVTANVVVLSHDGAPIQKSQLVVAANSVGRLALADFIKTEDPAPQWGSVILEFRQPSRSFGSVIVENYKQGVIFDLPIQGAYRYDTENALYVPWWLPDDGTDGTIALFNSSAGDITVSASVAAQGMDHGEPAFSIAPHETKKLSLRGLLSKHRIENARQGLVTLRYGGPLHALFPALLLSNPQTGFSLVPDLNAWHDQPQNPSASTTWQFPAVFLSPDRSLGFNPHETLTAFALLSNGGNVPLTPEINAYIGTPGLVKTVPLPVAALAPSETRLIDLSSSLAEVNPVHASHVALSVRHSGSPGDLAVTIFSIGPTKDFVFRSGGTVHPAKLIDSKYWDISGNLVSLLTVQNPGSTAIQAKATLLYPEADDVGSNGVGSYILPLLDLPANGSRVLNLNDLIRARTPDAEGHVIPVGVEFGTLTLEVADKSRPGILYGHSVVFDPIRGGYGFGGGTGCDLCDFCEFCQDDGDGLFECVPSCNCAECCPPPPIPPPPAPPAPTITSITPPQGLFGAATNVAINGTGFASGAQVNAGNNISVSNTQFVSASKITATFTPKNSTSAGGNQGVTVTVNGVTSNSANFFAQIPTSLGGPANIKTTYNGTALLDCFGQSQGVPVFFGYQECEAYTVLDQIGNQIQQPGMTFDENIQLVSTNVGITSRTGSGDTDSLFLLRDALALGSSTHAPSAGSFAVESQTIIYHPTGATVRVNCLDFEATDVTVKNITSVPATPCTRN